MIALFDWDRDRPLARFVWEKPDRLYPNLFKSYWYSILFTGRIPCRLAILRNHTLVSKSIFDNGDQGFRLIGLLQRAFGIGMPAHVDDFQLRPMRAYAAGQIK